MAIRVAINHKTRYQFDRLVQISPHIFRLRPAAHSRTAIEAYSFKVKPENHFINWQQDPFGNYQARLVFPEKTTELEVEVELIANLSAINPFDFFMEDTAKEFPFEYDAALKRELVPYLEIKEDGKLLKEWVSGIDTSQKMNTVDFLVAVNSKLYTDIKYSVRMEPGVQACEKTLQSKIGSCRDTGWLMVQILRHLGLAARFVSGYLIQLKADIKSLDGPSGPEEDFTDLHAWTEVYIPGAGWVGLDSTSGMFASEGHIPLACTPDYQSAAPITGTTEKCESTLAHHNTISRIFEDPRVTYPFSDEVWETINALGRKVDDDLKKHDVRLSMGGEPTFVSLDNLDDPQWNTEADGAQKKELADVLIKRLKKVFAPKGMLHYGQGKWYPGEPLPRWQYAMYWRKDGGPIWENDNLVGEEKNVYGATIQDAENFTAELANHLGIPANTVMPGYEDVLFYLWQEGKVPENVDPMMANLNDPLDRRNLANVLERGLGTPVGYILPIKWAEGNGWSTSMWKFRRGQCFLIPGRSPMGFRLPLDTLTHIPEEEKEPDIETDLFQEKPQLPDFGKVVSERYKKYVAAKQEEQKKGAAENIPFDPKVQTGLCVELRDGKLYIFIPPIKQLEHYLDLVSSIEATAAKFNIPVFMEGYEPPRDNRVENIKITPDPGVLEVNIHPAYSWDQLVKTITTLYEEAYQSRLGTEKFMLDGKHTGTGGGNHVTFGGPTPADSPVLRRPDLLRSLLTFWQHHPGLSYLFSSTFVGPTSQAPRVDEGRDDMLFELEIAFKQIPDVEEGEVPFWLVDRLFRNLLVDITGNTHRSEFCIDKLYAPGSASGRMGIVELRAFDMPPHARMSILQMLLVRSLISMFWQKPYKHNLVRWGTELHDRFLLPHYVRQDMREVTDTLNEFGYPFEPSWFDAFFEFRFPRLGTVQVKQMELELRTAIEPWHVLGEEALSTGTYRFVDSSLERLQVKLNNATDSRYMVTCNGCPVPMKNTGVKGEFVGGVRYRAWQPTSALHPTVGVDTPLVFDIIDTWNGRSIGGCTYYVSHPGGRSYDTAPVNSNEAEGRQISRFWGFGHSTGTLQVPQKIQRLERYFSNETIPTPKTPMEKEPNPEYPYTLDLRTYRSPKK